MFAFEVSLKLATKVQLFIYFVLLWERFCCLLKMCMFSFLQGEMLFLVKNYAECGALSDNAVFYKYLTFMIVFHNASGE